MSKGKCSFLILCCLLLFGSSCTPFSPEKKAPEEILSLNLVLTNDSLLYLPLYVALEQNFFADTNLAVQLHLTEPKKALTGLQRGEYDFMCGGAPPVFYAYQQKQEKLIMLGQIATSSGYFLLARPTNLPFSWPETKGKIIICPGSGEAATLALEYLLRQHNLRPFLDLHLINNLPPTLQKGAFLGGTADLILLDEPRATLLEKSDKGQVITSLVEALNLQLPTVIFTTQSQLEQKKVASQKLMRGLQKGQTWLNDHSPEEIATLAFKFFPKTEEKTLLRGICRYKNLGCWATIKLTEKDLEPLHQILEAAQELTAPLPLSELFMNQS